MTSASPETIHVAKAAFQDYAHGLSTGDWSRFLAHLSDDFTFWLPAGPFKGLNSGKDRTADFFATVAKVFPEGLILTLERTLNSGNTVLVEVRSQGLMLGHPYENQAAISFDVAGDKICGYREYLGVIFQLRG